MRNQLQIGEVAALLGISAKTIRYYQQIGLLQAPQRSESGYRLYTAGDLLSLQQIRRLRGLGLSLEHIKEALASASQGLAGATDDQTLRAILNSLEKELTTRIQALETQRETIRTLLASTQLDPLAFTEDEPASLYLDVVSEHMQSLLAEVDPAVMAQELRLDALLGSFHWPAAYRERYREVMAQSAQFYGQHPEHIQLLRDLTSRLIALADLPEDSTEVEHFVAYCLETQIFQKLQQSLGGLSEQLQALSEGGPYSQAMSDLMLGAFSPAQRRAFQEMLRQGAIPGS